MRTIVIQLLCLASFSFAHAQVYYPLIRPGLTWDVMDGDGSTLCGYSDGGHYFFDGDTVISGIAYKVIGKNPILAVNPMFCPPYYLDPSVKSIAGFIREDTAARKVFIYNYGTWKDELLYDFTLLAGDSIINYYAGSTAVTLFVDSVGTVTLLTGAVRKIFYLDNFEYFIESVGGSQGLQFPMVEGLGVYEVPTCMQEDSILIWGSTCVGLLGIEDSDISQAVNVFPNPIEDEFSIEHNGISISSVVITTITGQEIILPMTRFSSEIKVDASGLSSGIYLLKIISTDRRSQTFKIMKMSPNWN